MVQDSQEPVKIGVVRHPTKKVNIFRLLARNIFTLWIYIVGTWHKVICYKIKIKDEF